ncbi:MAG: hypothetical protein FWC27_02250 [Firmicutes bacterium]|nr:hypothetical protein [Bacillota bacterium]
MRKNKKLIMAMAIVLAIATMAGATFAWFQSDDGVVNHMETGQLTDGDVQIVEIFPVQDINPGVELDKVVWTVNSGNVDALVRVSFAEVLQMLDNNGAAYDDVSAVWANEGTSGNPTIPQLFSSDSVTGTGAYTASKGWIELDLADPGCPFNTATGIPAGVTVLYKEFTASAGTPNEFTTYSFVCYGTIDYDGTDDAYEDKYDGKLQYVTAEFAIDAAMALTVSDVKCWYFKYDDLIENKWADLARFTELGSFDLETPQNSDFALPMLASISDPGKLFELYFSANVKTSIADCNKGDWWYNEDDGYFYYIDKLAPGAATSDLLKSVKLNSDAEDAYCNLLYDLIVKMEAIQNLEEAVTASDGWDLDDSVAGSWQALLITKLTNVGAFVFS